MAREIMTTADWVLSIPQLHRDKHTYEFATYTGADNLVIITCKIHGNFQQRAYSHKSGCGCPTCYEAQRGASQRDDKYSFIAKTFLVPVIAGVYLYTKVRYVNGITPVEITCQQHGSFMMSPGNHLSGKGCKKCFDARRHLNNLSNLAEFCRGAISVHGETYTYTNVLYEYCKKKVEITCGEHGAFWMTPDNHLQGQGCPKCKSCGYNPSKKGYLYILTSDETTKVGITNRTPSHRIKEIANKGGPRFSEISHFFFHDGSIPAALETVTHQWLEERYKPVPDKFDGSTECFLNVDLAALLNFITPLAIPESV